MNPENLSLPNSPTFETTIEVRITDLNYGNHVGNDSFLRFAHEARVRWLAKSGFSEKDIGGVGLILTEAHLSFLSQAFYGDVLKIAIHAENFSRVSFNLVYDVTRPADRKKIATIRTKMVGFDYARQKINALPNTLQNNPKSI